MPMAGHVEHEKHEKHEKKAMPACEDTSSTYP